MIEFNRVALHRKGKEKEKGMAYLLPCGVRFKSTRQLNELVVILSIFSYHILNNRRLNK